MPEYSYGIWPHWELSFQLPLAEESGTVRSTGYRGELQYIAQHEAATGGYYGINFELGHLDRMGESQSWNLEVIPIAGVRRGRWHFVANPGITLPLSGAAKKVSFDPAAKVAYRAFGRNDFGLEYYLAERERTRMLYFAWDGKLGKSDINVGLGRGFTDASDRWVLKAIYEVSF
jgi:hypothetical protein